jgi:hypothetical protein
MRVIGTNAERTRRFIAPYRIEEGEGFRLDDIDPGDTGGLGDERKPEAKEFLQCGIELLAE